jgi:hypothetical protein
MPPIILSDKATRPVSHTATTQGRAGSRLLSVHGRRSANAPEVVGGSVESVVNDPDASTEGRGASEREEISVLRAGAMLTLSELERCLFILAAVATGKATISARPVIPIV